ncbi:MAG: phosphoribosyl-ATP pyrophosphohydrolase [Halieaceae bacterium]|jgi:phosphoribosyl-ATP pyrophosphohydrolase
MTEQTNSDVLAALDGILADRRGASVESSYVASLYESGLNRILEKIGEEATEVILAAKDSESGDETHRQALVGEVADLWFHSMVLLAQQELSSADVIECLKQRFGLSGHDEKASRKSA